MIFSNFHSQELRIPGRWQTGGSAHRHMPRFHYPHPYTLVTGGVILPSGWTKKLRPRKNVCIWGPLGADPEIRIQVQGVCLGSDPGNAGRGWRNEKEKGRKSVKSVLIIKFPVAAGAWSHGDLGGSMWKIHLQSSHMRGEGAGVHIHQPPLSATEVQSSAQTSPAPSTCISSFNILLGARFIHRAP